MNSIPVGRAVELGADRVFVLQVGRVDRPLKPPRKPWEVARVSFEIARRHRFVREMAALPEHVTAHVLPAGGLGQGRLAAAPTATLRAVARRIDAAYDAAAAYLAEHLVMPRRRITAGPAAGRGRAAVIVLTVLLLDHDPAVAARRRRRSRPSSRAGCGRCGCCGWAGAPDPRERDAGRAVRALDRLGLRAVHPQRPFFERIHYDIVQAYLVVFFREARRVLRLKIETVGPSPDAYPGRAAAGVLPARRARRTRSR